MARLRLLGGASVEEAGEVVSGALSRRHPLALLAILAAESSGGVGRSKVAGLLWPESPEERARNRLNTCIYRVRQALGEESIRSAGDDLRLNRGLITSDLTEFRTALEAGDAERAVRHYGGVFLEGFRLPDSAPFEKWVDRTRDRLERSYRDALEALAEEAEARGDPAEAVRWWAERASADPYDSRVVRRLMEARVRAGNRAAALSAARVHARLLEEELGAEPSEEVRALADRLERGGEVGSTPTDGEAERAGTTRDAEDVNSGGALPPASAGARPAEPVERERPSPWRVAIAAVGLVLTVAGSWWLLAGSEREAPPHVAHPSVAVLPFEPLGDEPADVLARGLHSDLLTRLSYVDGLKVVSGTSALRYRGTREPIRAVAADLEVGWVVEGSVQRAGDRVRINVQLIDPRTDAHAWARAYDREFDPDDLSGLFAIQEDVAGRVADELGARLTPAERRRIGRRPTEQLAAFRLYVEGRRHLEERTPERLESAVAAFRGALERDSSYALAWAGLADAVDLAATYGVELSGVLPEPETAAQRALALDPDLAEAHASLGRALFRDDVPAAVRSFRRAIDLRPSYAQAHHWLGYLELAFGDLALAREHIVLAGELNPRLLPARGTLARVQLAEGDYEQALSTTRAVQAMAAAWDRGAATDELTALHHLRRWDELRERAAHHREAGDGFDVSDAVVALAEAAEGDTAAARRAIPALEHRFWRGLVHAALGDVDRAFADFEQTGPKAPRGPWYVTAWRYYFPGILDSVRADPRFEVLMRDVRARWGFEPGEDLSPSA